MGAGAAAEGPDGDDPPQAARVAHNATSPIVDARVMAFSFVIFLLEGEARNRARNWHPRKKGAWLEAEAHPEGKDRLIRGGSLPSGLQGQGNRHEPGPSVDGEACRTQAKTGRSQSGNSRSQMSLARVQTLATARSPLEVKSIPSWEMNLPGIFIQKVGSPAAVPSRFIGTRQIS